MTKNLERWYVYIVSGVFLIAIGLFVAVFSKPDDAPITVGTFTNAIILPWAIASFIKLLIFAGLGLIVAGILKHNKEKT